MEADIALQLRDHPDQGNVGESSIFISVTDVAMSSKEPTLLQNSVIDGIICSPHRNLEVFATLVEGKGLNGNFDIITQFGIDMGEPSRSLLRKRVGNRDS